LITSNVMPTAPRIATRPSTLGLLLSCLAARGLSASAERARGAVVSSTIEPRVAGAGRLGARSEPDAWALTSRARVEIGVLSDGGASAPCSTTLRVSDVTGTRFLGGLDT
jgi:hypothetical protein